MQPSHDLNWRKSSHSDEEVNCVEVARLVGAHVGVRDSKAPDEPALTLDRSAWLSLRATLGEGG
ncbi:DUF397 domain-containing protein [Actinomadura rupiterrae]|uniref:DUF397 domain-containing protein n=1 Tax=Actinomadura rupiterrae TaxID=559627 RepID=UPI0020A38102|nr:DUF397 domain-containing protein [Actinomadura rupiterrae]MCP2341964.1 hypothetical protein [Actinomadura rupiterrae]